MSRLAARLLPMLLAGFVLGAVAARPAAAGPDADFALKALDGHNYRLSEYRGEVVAVIFWASWCGGCRDELQRLQELRQIYGDAGLQVLGVLVDDEVEQARAVAAATGAAFPQLVDASKDVSRSYQLQSLPAILLLDRAGAPRFRYGELDARDDRRLLGELRLLLDE